MNNNRNLKEGDYVVLINHKNKRKLIRLKRDALYFTHYGSIKHNDILNLSDGSKILTDKGLPFRLFKATYSDFVLGMKRQAQIIYPKDVAVMLLWADIYPGLSILEAGLGQGGLSIAILRLLNGSGSLVSYEIREDFAEQSKNFINQFVGEQKNHKIILGDIYNGFDGIFDRVLLDLAEPWRVIVYLDKGLVEGGIVIAYIPTILQVKTYVDTMQELGYFADIEVFENIKRPWQVKGLSVRPETWMYNHSAFIVYARKISEVKL
jgi:tRNA (adenine57-N1/adenine58-N1)-methyltransferase